MAGESRWTFTRAQIIDTPSRSCGIDSDKELNYRQQTANFIQDMGQRIQVTQLCINTAIVYMHRFYMFHSFTKFSRNDMAAACLFLAAKVEEQPRKLEHVIKVSHVCLQLGALDTKSKEDYLKEAQQLVVNENILLQTLGFDIQVDHPHTHVVKTCSLVRASKDLAQTSYFLATNSLHLTTMCLQHKPTVVACVCIHLACKWSKWEIPQSNEGREWFWYTDKDVTMDLLEALTQDFLTILDRCPSKLKKKILTWKSGREGMEGSADASSSKKSSSSSSGAQSSSAGGSSHTSSSSRRPDHAVPSSSQQQQPSSSSSAAASTSAAAAAAHAGGMPPLLPPAGGEGHHPSSRAHGSSSEGSMRRVKTEPVLSGSVGGGGGGGSGGGGALQHPPPPKESMPAKVTPREYLERKEKERKDQKEKEAAARHQHQAQRGGAPPALVGGHGQHSHVSASSSSSSSSSSAKGSRGSSHNAHNLSAAHDSNKDRHHMDIFGAGAAAGASDGVKLPLPDGSRGDGNRSRDDTGAGSGVPLDQQHRGGRPVGSESSQHRRERSADAHRPPHRAQLHDNPQASAGAAAAGMSAATSTSSSHHRGQGHQVHPSTDGHRTHHRTMAPSDGKPGGVAPASSSNNGHTDHGRPPLSIAEAVDRRIKAEARDGTMPGSILPPRDQAARGPDSAAAPLPVPALAQGDAPQQNDLKVKLAASSSKTHSASPSAELKADNSLKMKIKLPVSPSVAKSDQRSHRSSPVTSGDGLKLKFDLKGQRVHSSEDHHRHSHSNKHGSDGGPADRPEYQLNQGSNSLKLVISKGKLAGSGSTNSPSGGSGGGGGGGGGSEKGSRRHHHHHHSSHHHHHSRSSSGSAGDKHSSSSSSSRKRAHGGGSPQDAQRTVSTSRGHSSSHGHPSKMHRTDSSGGDGRHVNAWPGAVNGPTNGAHASSPGLPPGSAPPPPPLPLTPAGSNPPELEQIQQTQLKLAQLINLQQQQLRQSQHAHPAAAGGGTAAVVTPAPLPPAPPLPQHAAASNYGLLPHHLPPHDGKPPLPPLPPTDSVLPPPPPPTEPPPLPPYSFN